MATFDGGRARRKPRCLSRALTAILRHDLAKHGLMGDLRPDGFVPAAKVLTIVGASVDELRRVVAESDKRRFALLEERGVLFVRANQGHSRAVARGIDDRALLAAVTADEAAAPGFVCVHGTYHPAWAAIRNVGLSRMKREHVHCAAAVDPGAVVSGMRTSATVLIFLDAPRMLAAGLALYRSANGVLLSPGDAAGRIAPAFFARVVDAATGARLDAPGPPDDAPPPPGNRRRRRAAAAAAAKGRGAQSGAPAGPSTTPS